MKERAIPGDMSPCAHVATERTMFQETRTAMVRRQEVQRRLG